MTYTDFLKQLEELEENLDKNENEIDFTMLKMLKSIMDSKKENEKTEEQLRLQREVNEIVESILSRPEDYFESKERNIQKMIEKSKARNAIPSDDKDKEALNNQATINTITKLFDKIISQTVSFEVKSQLEDVKNQIKKINIRAHRDLIKKEFKKVNFKTKLILQQELKKEESFSIDGGK